MLTKQQLDKLNSILKKFDSYSCRDRTYSNSKYLCNTIIVLRMKSKIEIEDSDRMKKGMREILDAHFKDLKPIDHDFKIKGQNRLGLEIEETTLTKQMVDTIKRLIKISGDKKIKTKMKRVKSQYSDETKDEYTFVFVCKEFDILIMN